MFVCCECCVLSGRGLCNELITRPEESYRLWCVVVCDLETSRMRRPWPALGRSAIRKKLVSVFYRCVKTEQNILPQLLPSPPCITLCSSWLRVARSFETLVPTYQTTRGHITENRKLN